MQLCNGLLGQNVHFRIDLRPFFVRHIVLVLDEIFSISGKAKDGEQVSLDEVGHEPILRFLAILVGDVALDLPLEPHDVVFAVSERGDLLGGSVEEGTEA